VASWHPKGELGWRELTLEQSKTRMRGFLRAAGVTRSDLGVTAHGLRHQYATDLFQELTGLPAPVLRKAPYSAYVQEKEKVAAAFLEISRRMGHERPRVTQVYGGSVHRLRNDDSAGAVGESPPVE
jgi:integrase